MNINALNHPIVEGFKALVIFFQERIQALYDVDGSAVRQDIPVYLVAERDFLPSLLEDESVSGQVPHLRIGFPRLEPSHAAYKGMGPVSYDASESHTLTRGAVLPQPETKDLYHKLLLVAEDQITLAVLMEDFIRAFSDGVTRLCILDPANAQTRCYDMEVVNWPDATGAKGNNDGLLAAEAEIVIRGVQFFTGKVCELPYTILDFQIVVHGHDQEVVVDANGNVKIQPKSGG